MTQKDRYSDLKDSLEKCSKHSFCFIPTYKKKKKSKCDVNEAKSLWQSPAGALMICSSKKLWIDVDENSSLLFASVQG